MGEWKNKPSDLLEFTQHYENELEMTAEITEAEKHDWFGTPLGRSTAGQLEVRFTRGKPMARPKRPGGAADDATTSGV